MKPFHDITDPTVAKALAHPLRTRLLGALQDRTASPSELAAELDVPLGVLSYHIRRLTALGFLKLVRRVPRRGAVEHYYTATVRRPVTDEAWGATPGVVKEASIAGALGRLGEQVSAAASAGGFNSPEARISQTELQLDDQGWRELGSELAALADRVEEIKRQTHSRLIRRGELDGRGDGKPEAGTPAPADVVLTRETAVQAAEAITLTAEAATLTADAPAQSAPAQIAPRHASPRAGDRARLVLMLYEDPPAGH
ncbi:MAG TPA: helix-turn-helix domain-containing protein [Solirubrobacteraceae bacterium]